MVAPTIQLLSDNRRWNPSAAVGQANHAEAAAIPRSCDVDRLSGSHSRMHPVANAKAMVKMIQ
jgi:hypothetical protein